ncbi:class I SAM-dependent methyltransferase [filamentous cyanobacterium LEGE 11480]|uniref:Class I SAM-dependent methyltransferase n=1 Tax=Romeriopsis navalis LEGE 11480 TaxID=2777977 RepID=A0A928Z4Q0_9CYAN|nr:class I SAM-dependent methyltransferase [Romeriopsis navalis]MBE9030603.1 class I SAM-dependent methyltransferase [Romeriopsis navalis LEGE 11480]
MEYFYCSNCGLLQTETPYWLEEAYSSAIAKADTGLLSRNIAISKKLVSLLSIYFDKQAKYLDVAGGYGTLTRLMRDAGFDFYWQDIYCNNILSPGFEKPDDVDAFSAITAFEVLEHVVNPIEFLESAFRDANSSTIIFSTELFSETPPLPEDWWYYQFATGQHISFYQRTTLEFIAQKLSLKLYSNKNIHMLTNKQSMLGSRLFDLMTGKIGGISNFLFRRMRKSYTLEDHRVFMSNH